MNERQLRALTHPLNSARDRRHIEHLRSIRERGDKTLLVVILAVDR